MKAPSQLNQSNAMFTYDGDYSYLHKEETVSASKSNSESPLMWLKRDGYKENKSNSSGNGDHKNLMWLKISGYKQKNAGDSLLENKASMYATESFHETVYQQMQLAKAKYKFYFEAMSMLVILNLVVFFAFIHH